MAPSLVSLRREGGKQEVDEDEKVAVHRPKLAQYSDSRDEMTAP